MCKETRKASQYKSAGYYISILWKLSDTQLKIKLKLKLPESFVWKSVQQFFKANIT